MKLIYFPHAFASHVSKGDSMLGMPIEVQFADFTVTGTLRSSVDNQSFYVESDDGDFTVFSADYADLVPPDLLKFTYLNH